MVDSTLQTTMSEQITCVYYGSQIFLSVEYSDSIVIMFDQKLIMFVILGTVKRFNSSVDSDLNGNESI